MARRIRLFVVDPDPDVRAAIAGLARAEPRLEVAGTAGSLEEAAAAAAQAPADVALVAVDRVADADALAGAAIPILAYGREAQPDVMRRAMAAGARDFLVWPFTASGLLQALAEIEAAAPRDPAAGPVAVLSARGGCGRSSLALNLAVLLARRLEEEVALVDLDLDAGSLAPYAGVKAPATVADLVRLGAAVDSDALRQAAARVAGVPVRLFASPSEPGTWAATPAQALRGVVERIDMAFAASLLDLPVVFDERLAAVLDACGRVVFVTPAEVAALVPAARWLRRLTEAGWSGERLSVVCNRTHPEMKLPPQAVAEALGVAHVIQVPFDEAAALAAQNGQPAAARRSPTPFVRALEPLLRALVPQAEGRAAGPARAALPQAADVPRGLGPALPW
ncbi:MAG: P-loop NTPase [Firmicutes bacterium]|nr:P-loop NTPase [Bacillota bacterium]